MSLEIIIPNRLFKRGIKTDISSFVLAFSQNLTENESSEYKHNFWLHLADVTSLLSTHMTQVRHLSCRITLLASHPVKPTQEIPFI